MGQNFVILAAAPLSVDQKGPTLGLEATLNAPRLALQGKNRQTL